VYFRSFSGWVFNRDSHAYHDWEPANYVVFVRASSTAARSPEYMGVLGETDAGDDGEPQGADVVCSGDPERPAIPTIL